MQLRMFKNLSNFEAQELFECGVLEEPCALEYIICKSQFQEIHETAVERYSPLLDSVSDEYQTKDMCKRIVLGGQYTLEIVP